MDLPSIDLITVPTTFNAPTSESSYYSVNANYENMKCVMEKTRKQNKEEASRCIAYKYKGWKGSQKETERGDQRATGREGEPVRSRMRGGIRGQQDERGNQR
jgi:hypothetical protein